MWVMRQAEEKDFEAYENLAQHIDVGVTSFPKDRETLQIKMKHTLDSFKKQEPDPYEILYIFFLENESGEVIGTSSINAKTGITDPLYFYHVDTITQAPILPEIPEEIKVLTPVVDQEEFTELCGLYIMPEKRKAGLGHLLSFGRFLFIADYPDEIQERIVAVIRGVIDDNGVSPFWEAVGRKFLNVDFIQLCALMSKSKLFVPYFLPKHPLYISLLPPEVQEVIGQAHKTSKPALQMLLNEGFQLTDDIDIMDGGPRIEGKLRSLHTINSSLKAKVEKIDESLLEEHNFLISRPEPTFRACLGALRIISPNQVALSAQTAKTLRVEPGQSIRYIPNIHHR